MFVFWLVSIFCSRNSHQLILKSGTEFFSSEFFPNLSLHCHNPHGLETPPKVGVFFCSNLNPKFVSLSSDQVTFILPEKNMGFLLKNGH